MRYIFSYENPHHHYIDIEFIAEVKSDETLVQLPAWRPGRYELGNFAKNVQKWAAFDEKGKALAFGKVTKDCWKVQTKGVKELHIKYNYFAAELNAGSSYLDEKQLYVNPVNCCVYIPGRIGEECQVELKVPDHYKVATGMTKVSKHALKAKDYHELADCPFVASPTLHHNMFVLDGIEFNIWFQGEVKPNWSRVIGDFFIFINEQFVLYKEPTVEIYHFIFQILPYKFHHGVEHLNSTVIALGPSYSLMRGDQYEEFLGVSSHELFHSWNIKTIRPIEMMPYDYTKENYSRLGYVCEGVTTYYGDLLLFRSGVYSEFDYFKTVYTHLQRHFDNFGRCNLSVADSSFDTWLDGYNPGVPNRKASIYTEGALCAFMTDILIRKHSENRNSLDDVMRYLYFEFGKKQKGYSEADYKKICEEMAGTPLDAFFNKYVYAANSYEDELKQAVNYLGCELMEGASKKYYERYYGFKVAEEHGHTKVTAIYPGSHADRAGLQVNDEITAINGFQVKHDLAEWCRHFAQRKVVLTVHCGSCVKNIEITPTAQEFYHHYYIRKSPDATEHEKKNFESWSKRRF